MVNSLILNLVCMKDDYYFELVGVLNVLGYRENVDKLYYNDPQFGMDALTKVL